MSYTKNVYKIFKILSRTAFQAFFVFSKTSVINSYFAIPFDECKPADCWLQRWFVEDLKFHQKPSEIDETWSNRVWNWRRHWTAPRYPWARPSCGNSYEKSTRQALPTVVPAHLEVFRLRGTAKEPPPAFESYDRLDAPIALMKLWLCLLVAAIVVCGPLLYLINRFLRELIYFFEYISFFLVTYIKMIKFWPILAQVWAKGGGPILATNFVPSVT